MDDLPVGCIEADREGRLIYANQTLAGWLGCSPAELTDGSRRLGDILAPRGTGDGAAVGDAGDAIDPSCDIADLEVTLRGGGEILCARFSQTIVHAPGEPVSSRSVIWNVTSIDDARQDDVTGFKRLFEASPISLALVRARRPDHREQPDVPRPDRRPRRDRSGAAVQRRHR